jgi:hypothetical protein
MKADTAMNQADSTASFYFVKAVTRMQDEYPEASIDTILNAASRLAIAASVDYLAGIISGSVEETPIQNALEAISELGESLKGLHEIANAVEILDRKK